MTLDDRRLGELLEESQDLHSSGMTTTRSALEETVELGLESRARREINIDPGARRAFLRKGLFAAGSLGGLGAGLFGKAFTMVSADSASDIQMLQTAASIENLAIAVYTKAAGLDPAVSGAANPVVKAFVVMTIQQHNDHLKAFNAASMALGGKAQTAIDQPVYDAVVTPALAKIKGPSDVAGLAYTLEDAAAQTYVVFGSSVDDKNAQAAFASIAPVEAQHASVLLAVKALLDAGAPQLITLPPDLTKLPGAAGSVGFPKSFYPVDGARPAAEGAVK